MTHAVNEVHLPGGYRVVGNHDDTSVKAEALRLGVLSALSAELRKTTGQRGAVVLARDGDRLVAIAAWAGFASAVENGWASVSVTPVCEETAAWLVAIAHRLVDGDGMRMLERSAPWRN